MYGFRWAYIGASAAVYAEILIYYIAVITLFNGANRTGVRTTAATDAGVVNKICHFFSSENYISALYMPLSSRLVKNKITHTL